MHVARAKKTYDVLARVHMARTKKTYDVQSGCLWPGKKKTTIQRSVRVLVARTKKTYDVQSGCTWPGQKRPTIRRSIRVARPKHQQRIFRHNAHEKAHRVSHKDVHDLKNIRVYMTGTT